MDLIQSLVCFHLKSKPITTWFFQWYTTISDGITFQLYGQVDTGYHTLAGSEALVLMHDQDSVCESNFTEFTGRLDIFININQSTIYSSIASLRNWWWTHRHLKRCFNMIIGPRCPEALWFTIEGRFTFVC